MGWERKRGKLLDLNHLMRGGYDSFPIKVGDLTVLPWNPLYHHTRFRHQLPRDAAQRLVGTIAHPLHRAVVDPATKMVVAGYGILQPRIAISIDSAASSRLANIYSGQTGFDIYTRAVSDVYQDLFGEGIFTGKGIYDIDALDESLDERFPENALLSHDLIEGAYARAGLVTDIELIDDYPSHFSAYSRRKHRWVRGDWQIMRWVLPRVPDYHGRIIPNPLSLISRLEDYRQPPAESLRTSNSRTISCRLVCASESTPVLDTDEHRHAPDARLRRTALCTSGSAEAPVTPQTMVKRDSTGIPAGPPRCAPSDRLPAPPGNVVARRHRTLYPAGLRDQRRLLEWETAAEAENAQRRTATVDLYLAWSPLIAAAIGGLLYLVRPEALPVAAPILSLWFVARFLSAWLNRAPSESNRELRAEDIRFLRAAAVRTWRFFREHSGQHANWLIPDNVRETGEIAARLSPTNLGLLLNARLSAVHFGYLTVPEFIEETSATLGVIRRLVKYRGHVLNWYCTETVRCLEPRFVSTVDSGNLAVCLWA